MIVTLDTTIGFDKLVHVLKAENMVYSFISIHENQHFRYFGYLVYGFYLTSLIYTIVHFISTQGCVKVGLSKLKRLRDFKAFIGQIDPALVGDPFVPVLLVYYHVSEAVKK
jgi:hypothetical protein